MAREEMKDEDVARMLLSAVAMHALIQRSGSSVEQTTNQAVKYADALMLSLKKPLDSYTR